MSAIDLRPRSHEALERLVLFEFRLTCRTGLHIGAGKSADLAGSDLPVLRDAAGRPLVPGSSLRGILRSGVEALQLSLGLNEVRSLNDSDVSKSSEDFAKRWREMTLVERLFGRVAEKRGAFSYGSRLQISDAVANGDVAVELRDGVGIDRETRTAGTGVKFDLEVVPAGTTFAGKIRFKNPADHEIGLLAQALWMLDEGGLLLGGKSARGLGWVEVAVTPPRRLDAKTLLAGSSALAPGEAEPVWGPVREHFQEELARLRELADAAAKLVA
ncbi:MAG: CRISPR-associated RAMP protein Csx7 [Thermoanaerobaculia bacterium]